MSTTPPIVGSKPVNPPNRIFILLRGLAGAVIGGVLGYVLFRWLLTYRLYAIMIPGAALGMGAGLLARGRTQSLAILCAVAAIAVGIFSEWSVFPFKKDPSFGYFISHVHQLTAPTLLFIGVGALCAYWFGQGR
jgi:hypothetical protein